MVSKAYMKRFGANQIEDAIELLKDGGVLIFPTETSYGIGCDATNVRAVERVFDIKHRPVHKGTPLILPDSSSAKKYVVVTPEMQQLMDRHWPGPLNIVGDVVSGSPVAARCSERQTQTVRVSSHPIASALARGLGRPLVATSANVNGKPPMYVPFVYDSADADLDALRGDAVIDAGEIPQEPASTIVRVTGEGKVEVLRQGSIRL